MRPTQQQGRQRGTLRGTHASQRPQVRPTQQQGRQRSAHEALTRTGTRGIKDTKPNGKEDGEAPTRYSCEQRLEASKMPSPMASKAAKHPRGTYVNRDSRHQRCPARQRGRRRDAHRALTQNRDPKNQRCSTQQEESRLKNNFTKRNF